VARKQRSPLETRKTRLALPVGETVYWVSVAYGVGMGYRRNKGVGGLLGRVADGKGGYEFFSVPAVLDDVEEANGKTVLKFDQGADLIRKLARADNASSDPAAPATVATAIDDYRKDLRARGGDEGNANRLLKYLSAALLSRPVALLTTKELRSWRDGLLDQGLSKGAVTRICTSAQAALNCAARLDERISKRPWTEALKRLPGAWVPVDRVLPDDAVRGLVLAAYDVDPRFGLFVNLLATTGARASQVLRLTGGDLRCNGSAPRLMMPTSKKGRRREAGTTPIPIPAALAAELAGREPSALLFPDWTAHAVSVRFVELAKDAGIDATAYSLRHSAITRMLLRGTPIRIVAALHDTSTAMIEKTYGRFIAEYSDDVVRSGMLDVAVPADGKVMTLARGTDHAEVQS
jgi:integrase